MWALTAIPNRNYDGKFGTFNEIDYFEYSIDHYITILAFESFQFKFNLTHLRVLFDVFINPFEFGL